MMTLPPSSGPRTIPAPLRPVTCLRWTARSYLAQHSGEKDLHLGTATVRHPDADAVAPSEWEPLARPELPLQESLRPGTVRGSG